MEGSRNMRSWIMLCVLPLLASLSIYVFFRPKSILINELFFQEVPNFTPGHEHWFLNAMVYSLPGALWLFAFLQTVQMLQVHRAFLILPILMAFGIEFIQYVGWSDGTFDWVDVISYVLSAVLFWGFRDISRSDIGGLSIQWKAVAISCFAGIVIFSDVWEHIG